ncbi:MAG: magnesium/cobalt transporter CorA [Thermomicrobiales bacterium]
MAMVELCIDGSGTEHHDPTRDEIREILRDPTSLVWITVGRSREHLDEIGDALGFHDLAIEDATDDNERPKATVFAEHVFILLYSLERKGDRVVQTPISFFVGGNYLVTVTDERPDALRSVAQRWKTLHARIEDKNPGILAYSLIDSIVDDYFPIVDTIGDKLEDLESSLVEHKLAHPQSTIHDLRMELLQLRRVIGPEREAINVLLRRDVPVFGQHTTDYLNDVYDHLLRILDWLDTYRDVLSNLSDLQISVASHRLNQTMRMMTAWSIIFMATTLIAGIYGMNFRYMPELEWHWGYPASLVVMAALGAGMFVFFRKRDWL